MDAKLTLKLDKNVIEKAKDYAASQKRSLSRLIEAYLKSLVEKEVEQNELEISPFIKSLQSGSGVPVDVDSKKEYREHLDKKHK
ncbi:MAG: hypothetical protein KDC92_00540 [Bacteroidetes bacterium]|nr:hypothetical protein [Bacteroidota bacterium]